MHCAIHATNNLLQVPISEREKKLTRNAWTSNEPTGRATGTSTGELAGNVRVQREKDKHEQKKPHATAATAQLARTLQRKKSEKTD